MTVSLCDKCGKQVEPQNDATFFDAFLSNDNRFILFYQGRHLYPTKDCEGSPSRVRNIESIPGRKEAYKRFLRKYRRKTMKTRSIIMSGIGAVSIGAIVMFSLPFELSWIATIVAFLVFIILLSAYYKKENK